MVRIWLLCLLFLSAPVIRAQENVWLWEIRKDAGSQPSYLYLFLPTAESELTKEFHREFSRIEPYFNRCGSFATIWPLDAGSRNLLVAEMQTGEKKGLRRYVSKEDWSLVERMVRERLGDDLVSYTGWEPLYLRRHLSEAGRRPARGQFWQESLYNMSRDRGKAVRTIVSPRWLGAAYSKIDRQIQADMLVRYCDRPEPFDRALEGLSALYLQNDWTAYREAEAAIRGKLWADQYLNQSATTLVNGMLNLALQGQTFFAIDAVHMAQPGTDLVSAIRDRGWTVEAVEIPGLYAALKRSRKSESGPAIEPDPAFTEAAQETPEAELTLSPELDASDGPLFAGLSDLALPTVLEDPFGDLLEPGDLDTSFLTRWSRFRPVEKDFSVRLPYRPQSTANQYRAEGGILDVQLFQLNDPETRLFYLVGRTTYPYPFELKDPVSFFDNAVEEAIRNFDGRMLRERVLSAPAYVGREFVMELRAGGYLRSRLMLSGNRLYQILLAGEGEVAWGPYAEAFLQNFSIRAAREKRAWASVSDSRFSTRMPQKPATGDRQIQTPDGTVEVDVWSLEDPLTGILYFVSASRYPAFSGSGSAFLDRIVWSTASNLGGTVHTEEKIQWQGRKGRYVEIRSAARWYHIRFFFDGDNLIQVMAGSEPGKLEQDDINRYFESLKWPERAK